MKTYAYFYKNSGYNAIVFEQPGNGFYIMLDGAPDGRVNGVDLYSDTAADDLRAAFAETTRSGDWDLTGVCNSSHILAGTFDPSGNDEYAEIIAEFEETDLSPYCEGLY